MPVDTLNEMILGFVVILGLLLVYVLTLILRSRRLKAQEKDSHKESP